MRKPRERKFCRVLGCAVLCSAFAVAETMLPMTNPSVHRPSSGAGDSSWESTDHSVRVAHQQPSRAHANYIALAACSLLFVNAIAAAAAVRYTSCWVAAPYVACM